MKSSLGELLLEARRTWWLAAVLGLFSLVGTRHGVLCTHPQLSKPVAGNMWFAWGAERVLKWVGGGWGSGLLALGALSVGW